MNTSHRAGLRHRQAARVLINDFKQSKQPEGGGVLRDYAYLSSALYHLRQVYGCHLRFIAARCGVADAEPIDDIKTLNASLAARDSHSPELAELENLVREGWLADLLAAYQGLSAVQAVEAAPDSAQQGRLSLVDAREQDRALSVANVERWLQSLEGLIAAHQQTLEEY